MTDLTARQASGVASSALSMQRGVHTVVCEGRRAREKTCPGVCSPRRERYADRATALAQCIGVCRELQCVYTKRPVPLCDSPLCTRFAQQRCSDTQPLSQY